MDTPLHCTWTDDGTFKPWPRFSARCDKELVVGESYVLAVQEERSANSHRHYFASIAEAWRNLPDAIAMDYPTTEHLRKRALIDAGYYDERRLIVSSPAEARKVAAFLDSADDFTVISVAGNVVIERKAKSQSVKAMGRAAFQDSKTKVLDILAAMIGVDAGTLAAQTSIVPDTSPAPGEVAEGAEPGRLPSSRGSAPVRREAMS